MAWIHVDLTGLKAVACRNLTRAGWESSVIVGAVDLRLDLIDVVALLMNGGFRFLCCTVAG
jgi:hypothetical protein